MGPGDGGEGSSILTLPVGWTVGKKNHGVKKRTEHESIDLRYACEGGTALRTSLQSHSPNSTTLF